LNLGVWSSFKTGIRISSLQVFLNAGSGNIQLDSPLTTVIGNLTVTGNSTIGGTLSVTGACSASSFNATSDYRMKRNVQTLDSQTIDPLNPVEYDLSGGKHDMGFLAHEVQEVFPFLVEGEKEGKQMQSLNYNGFIALLVKEVKDLKKALKSQNTLFERRLQALEAIVLK
jgi:hypothetical protein